MSALKFVSRAAVAVTATIMSMAAAEEALAQRRFPPHICLFHEHSGVGTGSSRQVALARAVAKWRFSVRLHDGPRWSSWARACRKSQSCRRWVTGQRCTVRALPG